MRSMSTRASRWLRALPALAAAVALAGAARAAEGQHVLWEVAGHHNKVYLLGSVHMLHATDHALPAVTDGAYGEAEVLVEELDLFAAQSEMLSQQVLAQQFLPQGQSLATVLGPELNDRLRAAAMPLGLDPAFLDRMQPWYVAALISDIRLQKAGYSSTDGVDFQIADRARRDGKPIVGLETVAQQLGFFAGMPMAEQRDFLAAALDEDDTPEEMRTVADAWRRGDLKALESELKQGMEESPDLFQTIVVQRNRNWLPRIEQMLDDPDKDYLVVTGALHMIGPQGLVQMLRARGYRIKRK
jgi:uncharacterized protein YbaP (TraB family)